MTGILAITAPLVLLIGLGYTAVRLGWLHASGLSVLGAFVMRFALPALLFAAVSRRELAEVMDLDYLVAYLLGSLVPLVVGLAWGSRGQPRDLTAGAMAGLGMASANTAFIGFPVASQVVGSEASLALALCMMVENLVILPLTLALAASGGGRGTFWPAFARALANLPRNPLIIAILAGFAVSLLALPLPDPLTRAVDLLASTATGVALFVVGGSLVGLAPRALNGTLIPVAFGKLVLHPLAVLVAMWLVGPSAPGLQVAAVLMAAAPMLSIYPILGQRYGLASLCSARLVTTTLLSFVTIPLVIAALRWSGWP